MASMPDCEGDLRRARDRAEIAAGAVLAGEADRLLTGAAAPRDDLETRQATLDFLSLHMPTGAPERQRIALTPLPLQPAEPRENQDGTSAEVSCAVAKALL
jgi:hypothetical protein